MNLYFINSNIFSLCTKLEGYVLKEIFDEEFVDIWIAYVYPAGDTSYSKEDPFLYMTKEDSNEKIPVVWDDETFIDYMYEHLKE